MSNFRPYAPSQAHLLPPSPHDWLPEDHLAYFILQMVEELDLTEIYHAYSKDTRGRPPHHPKMMLALLLYAYAVGVPSSRKIERKTHEDVAFRVLAAGEHPDHTRISEFRRVHLKAIESLFLQVLKICQMAGLVKLGHVAIDGTKMKANASKHKAMSYDRMKKREPELARKVKELLAEAEAADAEEDKRYGRGKRGEELPEDLRRAKSRQAKIREAMAALEADAQAQKEAKEKAKEESKKEPKDPPPPAGSTPLPEHKVQAYANGTPKPKSQRNFTDPDSCIMKSGSGFIQAYNCQAAVDAEHQIIVAQAVTNQPPDTEHLVPMLERVVAGCGSAPSKLSADAGYFSADNVAAVHNAGSDPYIATGRLKRGEEPPKVRGRPPANQTPKQAMARKLATKKGKKVYAQRKVIVEPVFGQMKCAQGLKKFLLRGQKKVRGEWSLMTTAHNILKLHRALRLVPA